MRSCAKEIVKRDLDDATAGGTVDLIRRFIVSLFEWCRANSLSRARSQRVCENEIQSHFDESNYLVVIMDIEMLYLG